MNSFLRITLVFTQIYLYLTCSGINNQNENILVEKQYTIKENPSFPPDELPRLFIYPDAKLSLSAIYNGARRFQLREGAVVLNTNDSLEQISGYYQRRLARSGWNIIQSHKNEKELMLMAESPGDDFDRLITIIARKHSPNQIKIYFKKNEG